MIHKSKQLSLLAHCADAFPNSDDLLFTRSQAAQYLQLSPATLATWACTHRHNIPYIKLGRCVRYRKVDLDQFLERNKQRVDLEALSGNSVFTWAQKGI